MRGKTGRLKVVVSMFMLMALFVFGAVFMTACESGCTHENMEHHAAVSATCTQTGNSEYWTCPDCNKIFADEGATEELSAIPEIAKTAHVWETAYQNDENGHWHKCRNCDATSASEPHTVAAIGEEKPATCTEDGVTAGKRCSVCNYVIEEQKTLSKLEHKLTHFNAKEANCSSVGNIEYWYCERCDSCFTDEAATQEVEKAEIESPIDPSAHKFGAMQDEVAATCTATGVKAHKDCEYCKKHFAEDGTEITDLTIAIDPSAHKFGEMQDEVAATCTAAGTKAHKDCEYCGKHFDTDGTEIADLTIDIDPSAHKFGEMQSAVAATCTTAGTKAHKDCEYCKKHFDAEGKEITDLTIAIDPSAHKFGEMQSAVAATCTTAGTKAHKDCEYCGKHFDTDGTEIADLTIAALGHSYAEIVISAQPEKLTYFVGENFDATGMEVTATCEHCQEKITVPDYTLSDNTSLEKGAKTVVVTWGEETLTVNVSVSVYEKHDLLQEGSYADFVYAASGDLTATAKQSFSGENGKLLYNGTAYEVFFSGASLTLKEATVKGLLGEKTYGDFAVTLITDSFDQYEMSIAIVTMVIDSADDLTTITQTNQETALVDGYYIVTADLDAAKEGIQMSGSVEGNNWSAKAVSFVDVDAALSGIGFSGIFDGRGHTISNLNTFSYKYKGMGGLFGQLLEGSVVRNVAFTDVTIAGRFGCVLVGYDSQFKGAMENVVITVKENLANDSDVAAKRAKILWELSGGSIYNCLFVNVEEVSVRGEVESMDKLRVMSVTPNAVDAVKKNGGINGSSTKYSGQSNYESINAMFAELKEENVLSGWNCGITYADGVIFFNGAVAAKPVIVISYECENNEVARGASVTFTTDGYAQISLKESVEGVAVEENVLRVAGTVAENAEFTVLVTSTLNASVTQEIVFKVIRAYQDVSIETALDFSLEGENSSVQAEIEGNVERIVAGETQVTEGITVSDGTLTLTKAALTALLNGKQYAEGLTVNIFTSADKKYTATVNIVTKVIDSLADLESIRTTGDTLDGYFILGQSFTANNDPAMQKLIGTWSSDANKGFVGIFDGRSHSITGLKLTNQGLFRCMGRGVVRNLALIDVYVEGVDADTASAPQYTVSVFGDADCKGATFENLFISTNAKGMIHNVYGNITMKNIIFVSSAEDSGYLSNSGGSDGGSYSVENALIVGTDEIRYYGGTPDLVNTAVYDSAEALLAALDADSFTEWGSLFTYSEGAIFFNGVKVLENVIA